LAERDWQNVGEGGRGRGMNENDRENEREGREGRRGEWSGIKVKKEYKTEGKKE